MQNQVNIGDQNGQQIGQNPVSRPVQTIEKSKVNYPVISVIVLVCFIVFGSGGYYLGKQSSQYKVGVKEDQSSPTPAITGTDLTVNDANNYDKAVKILQAIQEIQIIENAVIKNGRKVFFSPGDVNGDVVKVWFYEGGFPDQHITRIDTFNVNIKSKLITVDDAAMISGQEFITLDEWGKTIKERFQ